MNNQDFVKHPFSQYSRDIFAICADFRQRLEQLNRLKNKEKRNESNH
jgi:hypothetical protein